MAATTEVVTAHKDLHSEQGSLADEHPGRAKDPVTKVRGLSWLEFEKKDLDRTEAFARDFGLAVQPLGAADPSGAVGRRRAGRRHALEDGGAAARPPARSGDRGRRRPGAARGGVVPPAGAGRGAGSHAPRPAPVHPALANRGHGGHLCGRPVAVANAWQQGLEQHQPAGVARSGRRRAAGPATAGVRAHGQPGGRGRRAFQRMGGARRGAAMVVARARCCRPTA